MAQQTLNTGSNANDGTGDTLRSAMQKVNTMFTELYLSPLTGGDLSLVGNEISATRSNEDLVFKPSGAGAVSFPAIRINDNNIEGTRSNENINLVPSGTGSVVFGAVKFRGTTLSSDDSTAININDGLIVDGTLNVSGTATTGPLTAATGSTFGNLTLGNGSITDSSGAISFGNENLSTTGTLVTGNVTLSSGSIIDSSGAISFGNENLTSSGTINSGTGSTIGNLTLGNGSITDSSGAISFGNENLSTTGTLVVGNVTLSSGSIIDSSGAISFGNENLTTTGTVAGATGSTFGNLTLANGSITDSSGAISFGNETLTTTGTITAATGSSLGNLTLGNGSITDSSGAISFGDENLTTTGTLDVGGLATLGSLTVTGAVAFGGGGITVDNLILNDNIISSSSNADIDLTPGGTGVVNISNLTVDSNINITDNEIKTTTSNSDLVIAPAGTGQVVIAKADINSGAIDNTVIGATTPLAGSFTTLATTSALTIDGVTIDDNTVSTNASNANLELAGNGTGIVTISGFGFPTTDGSADQVLKTDGSGNLGFVTLSSPSTLNHSEIGDNTATIAASATSLVDSWASATYRSAKYHISISDATNGRFEIVEVSLIHGPSADSTTEAYLTVFGNTSSYTDPLCTFTADIDDGNVRLLTTNISSDSTVFKFQRTLIDL